MRPLLLLAAFSALLLSSCFSAGDGKAPPLQALYFPTGLALDQVTLDAEGAPKYLYVASSDFDLQYRSSALASYDLELVREVVPRSCASTADCRTETGEACDTTPTEANGNVPSFFCVAGEGAPPCGAFGQRNVADRLLNPGRCSYVNPVEPQDGSMKLIHDTVGIGAFATDVLFRANTLDPGNGASGRLFLPVRGDATLHWIDLEDGHFECGQGDTEDGSCNGAHRSGDVTSDNNDGLRQPSEPFAIAASGDAKYVAVTNQTTGSVSLFVTPNWAQGPKLAHVLGGLPLAAVAIAAIPAPSVALSADPNGEAPGFLVAYRNAAQVDLLRVREDAAVGSYSRYSLRDVGTAFIGANSLGFDSRSIAIDDEQRQLDYAECGADPDRNCLLKARQPKVYIANRAPSSLIVGGMMPDYAYTFGTSELPSFIDTVPLTSGPSRVVLGKVRVANGKGGFDLKRRVFVVCFDSRRIFVYDPERHLIESIIGTGRGPYALAVDDKRGLAYVAHFTDSYLGVINLDQRFPKTYATIVASIGAPSPPRSSK